jgi:DEAD/DEAH box helicase domain-containing protein
VSTIEIDRLRPPTPGEGSEEDPVAAARDLPGRGAEFAEPECGIATPVARALAAAGIDRLYAHQARAVESVARGEHVVVVTGTASGKTLCYNVPVFTRLLEEPLATALYLFPTKALARDQLKGIEDLRRSVPDLDILAGTYDGDTPGGLRRKLRDRGSLILTNPDMLHQGILPHHARWSRFLGHLRYVVIDEVHAYRGVFGSHLANVIRRLRRVARHHGVEPQFIASSATIANPGEHASRLTGVTNTVITGDASPRGPRRFLAWNPPRITGKAASAGGDRKSAIAEAAKLLAQLVESGTQTIAFTRTRLAAELVAKGAAERLARKSRRLAASVAAYRGGYLPEERREIERKLGSRELMGVASTNALELGIDIGSLDACLILGYPGTVASLWQQAGRAGRGEKESLVILVARNSPVDQFLVNHTDWLLARPPERAVIDPDNPHVTVGHLRCAAHELPLTNEEARGFGEFSNDVLMLLEDEAEVTRIEDRWYFSSSSYPAADVNLRNIAGPVVTIEDVTAGGRVIGTLDELSALTQLHDHAVYLHAGDTYFVVALDLVQKIARVERRDLTYYTQAVTVSRIRIDRTEEEADRPGVEIGYGEVTVTTEIPMFKKVRFHSRESLGFERLELPEQSVETVATWIAPSRGLLGEGRDLGEALVGIANVLVEVVPVFLMCDTSDIGAAVDTTVKGGTGLFLYDRFPGGMGYARGALDRLPEILTTAEQVIRDCPCETGCPACVGSAVPNVAANDLDTSVRGRIPDKRAAAELIGMLTGSGGPSTTPAAGEAAPAAASAAPPPAVRP